MTKQEYKEFKGELRKKLRSMAKKEFEKDPALITMRFPYFQLLTPISVDRTALEPLGNCEMAEVILNKDGHPIHEKIGEDWRHSYIEITKEKKQ